PILYDGADADLRTRVDLERGVRFIGADVLCFGLPARGEGFARGRCRQALEIWRGGRPLLVERGRFDGAAAVHAGRWGLGGAPVLGTPLAPPAPADRDGKIFAAGARAGGRPAAGQRGAAP